MSTLILGGTGFIGRRLVPLLAQRGEEVVCMDINPGTASYEQLGKQVRVVRGDVTQFDDVMAVTVAAKPSRVVNLAYFLGSEHAPHVATKLNIVGMDNCFEAARLCGVNRVVFASSLAVSGEQKLLRRPRRQRGRFPARPRPVCDAQDLQRMAGAGLPREIRHGDHRDPPGQCHRPRQDRRLGRPRQMHHLPGARRVDLVPLQGRDALPGPCRRHRRGVRPGVADRQAAPRGLQYRRHRRSASATSPSSCASSCPTRRSPSSTRPAARRSPAIT